MSKCTQSRMSPFFFRATVMGGTHSVLSLHSMAPEYFSFDKWSVTFSRTQKGVFAVFVALDRLQLLSSPYEWILCRGLDFLRRGVRSFWQALEDFLWKRGPPLVPHSEDQSRGSYPELVRHSALLWPCLFTRRNVCTWHSFRRWVKFSKNGNVLSRAIDKSCSRWSQLAWLKVS